MVNAQAQDRSEGKARRVPTQWDAEIRVSLSLEQRCVVLPENQATFCES